MAGALISVSDEDLKQVLDEVIRDFLIPKFISLGMNATGKWIESLQSAVENGRGYIRGQYYTYWLVNGRSAGVKPPIQPIIKWVEAKLGKTGEEGKSIAYAVRHKIGEVGTDWYPQGSDLLEVLESKEVKNYIYSRLGGLIQGQLRAAIIRTTRDNLTKNRQ